MDNPTPSPAAEDSAGLLTALIGDGRPLLALVALGLMLSGIFAAAVKPMYVIAWKTRPARALWQALLIGGLTGFGCAIGVHYMMGYETISHLIPAWTGAVMYTVGILCFFPASTSRSG